MELVKLLLLLFVYIRTRKQKHIKGCLSHFRRTLFVIFLNKISKTQYSNIFQTSSQFTSHEINFRVKMQVCDSENAKYIFLSNSRYSFQPLSPHNFHNLTIGGVHVICNS